MWFTIRLSNTTLLTNLDDFNVHADDPLNTLVSSLFYRSCLPLTSTTPTEPLQSPNFKLSTLPVLLFTSLIPRILQLNNLLIGI